MTVFLHFLLASPQYTSFLLQVLLSRRYFPIKIAIFETFKKRREMDVFVRQNSPLRNAFFSCFPQPSSWPVRELRFGPPGIDWGFKMRICRDNRQSIINYLNTICNASVIVDKWDPLDKYLFSQHRVSGGRTLLQADPQCQDIIWLTTITT